MFDSHTDIDSRGAVRSNQSGFKSIWPQGDGAWFALALAIAHSNQALFEKGIRALEFGLAHQNSDGSFQQSSRQATFRFGVFGLRAYRLARESIYAVSYQERLESILSGLAKTENYLLSVLPEHGGHALLRSRSFSLRPSPTG